LRWRTTHRLGRSDKPALRVVQRRGQRTASTSGAISRWVLVDQEVSMTAEQPASESAIRALSGRWAIAVQAGDLDGVLADHSDDIQMFDVPPPSELRGIDAYRKTWPPFLTG
jgi:hypothetical protein